jgi:hypothetical protein
MNKFVLVLMASFCALTTSAQSQSEVLNDARQARQEMVRQVRLEQRVQELSGKQIAKTSAAAPTTASLTDDTVGEAGSFNKAAKFFGTASTGVILVEPDCDPLIVGDLGPDDRCLEITDPAITTIGTFNNIGRITLPGKLADNIIYLIGNHTASYIFQNTTGAPVSALASYIPSVTIESAALNDPAAIDPNTNLPMNGSYTTTGIGSKFSNQTLAAAAIDSEGESFTRANTNGFSRTFWTALGLPDSVINEIYKKPMTIKLNVTVRVRRVESGVFFFSTRLLGN